MAPNRNRKKNLIVSYKNLSDDLKNKFKEAYPEGYSDYMQRFTKPNGEIIFVVPFETEDTAYMVKFDVKIDTLGEDLDKALFDDDGESGGKEEEFAPLSEALDKEDDVTSHREKHLRHGDFEDILSEDKKKKATLGIDKEGIKEAFGDDEDADELDSYDKIGDEDDEPDDDFEPSDEDLRGIEDEFLDAEIPPLDATIPEEEAVKPAKSSTRKKSLATTAKKSQTSTAKKSQATTAKKSQATTAKKSQASTAKKSSGAKKTTTSKKK
ncbi:MAG: hypothetical protein J6W88_05485 [Bacteroidales bacterium]|nr:hypothetical protein [Bacteroidales bacterium]